VTAPATDPTVADSDTLLRRIPNWPKMVSREADGRMRPSSAALELRDNERGCSVDVLERTVAPERPLDLMRDYDLAWGLAWCSAQSARKEDQHRVVGEPLEDIAAHALIVPTTESRSKQKRNFRSLAQRMVFIRDPDLTEV
jgi:hypothetical protein